MASDPATTQARLYSVKQVAEQLDCSTRTIYRLVGAEKMPPPVKIGSLVRFDRIQIHAWIDRGCPRVDPPRDRPSEEGKDHE